MVRVGINEVEYLVRVRELSTWKADIIKDDDDISTPNDHCHFDGVCDVDVLNQLNDDEEPVIETVPDNISNEVDPDHLKDKVDGMFTDMESIPNHHLTIINDLKKLIEDGDVMGYDMGCCKLSLEKIIERIGVPGVT